jgi:hypothetical protein
MYLITIAISPVAWPLMFQTEDRAKEVLKALRENEEVDVTDDFGQTVIAYRADIAGIMFEDMNQSRNAHIERALHEGRLRANLQTRAKADPVLRHAQMSGPAMISPMGNGFQS